MSGDTRVSIDPDVSVSGRGERGCVPCPSSGRGDEGRGCAGVGDQIEPRRTTYPLHPARHGVNRAGGEGLPRLIDRPVGRGVIDLKGGRGTIGGGDVRSGGSVVEAPAGSARHGGIGDLVRGRRLDQQPRGRDAGRVTWILF